MKKVLTFCIIIVVLALFSVGSVWWAFGPTQSASAPLVFAVPQKPDSFDVAEKLLEQQLIKNASAFRLLADLLVRGKAVASGGYRLNKNMNAWQILQKVYGPPDLLWVTIAGCQRKEQIGEKLAKVLSWTADMEKEWDGLYVLSKPEYAEGVYYPDTYLIPKDETVTEVAERFINHFNEQMAPLFPRFAKQNIRWTTGLKIASLIEREAGSAADMPVISGVIWNRLNKNMLLQIDATNQYAKGKTDKGWWSPVSGADMRVDSPFNTYLNKGLPPQPICSPGVTSMEAVLDPEATDCLFYLHDRNGQIHCAVTYKEHKENIRNYLQ